MNIDYARQQMVRQQVRGWNVYDEDVLRVLQEVPREAFVPADYAAMAFADTEVPIGHGQHMMTPTLEGRVLQALGLAGSEHVLEIGTGSGFLTACLAKLSHHVTSIDIYDDFVESASARLADAQISNIDLKPMNAIESLPQGEFDAIAVTGSIQSFDPRFVDALAPHGKLFVVVGDGPAMAAKLIERTEQNDWQSLSLFETSLAPLANATLPPRFSF